MNNKTRIIIAVALLIFGIYLTGLTSALTLESFSAAPEEVAPGKTAEISILMKNSAEEDAEEIDINLDLTNVPIAPHNSGISYSTDIIETDKSKRINFEVIALNDAKSGIYKIPVHVKYKEDGVAKTFDSLVSIMINSKPILEVGVEDGLLLKEKQNTLTIKIINKGLGDVKFSDISLGTSIYYTIVSPSKVYIGDVDSNDFQTTEYKIFFKENSPNSVSIPFTMTYKDVSGKEYSIDSAVSAKVYDNKEALNLGLIKKSNAVYYVIAVIAVLVIIFIYRIIRKRRRMKEEY
jgi:hypothetical protein